MARNSLEFHRNLKNISLAVAGSFLKGPSGYIMDRPESGTIGYALAWSFTNICFKICNFAL
jgi:hypothetical protein